MVVVATHLLQTVMAVMAVVAVVVVVVVVAVVEFLDALITEVCLYFIFLHLNTKFSNTILFYI